jgi:hypothetical protein
MNQKIISVAILGALFSFNNAIAETYYAPLGEKSNGQFIVGDVPIQGNGDNNGGSTPPSGAGEEKEVPSNGYDYENFQVGTFSTFLRNSKQQALFGSSNTLTHDFIYDPVLLTTEITGDTNGNSENSVLYLDSEGFKLIYNPSSFQLNISTLESISPNLSLEAQKNGSTMKAFVSDAVNIEYDTSSNTIELNGSSATDIRTFEASVGLYLNYVDNSNEGTFTFTSPYDLGYGTHDSVQYSSNLSRVDFTGGEYIQFNSSNVGFEVSDGTVLDTASPYHYNTSGTYEGYYEYDSTNGNIIYSEPKTLSAGTYFAQRPMANFGQPFVYLKLGDGSYLEINYNGSNISTNGTDSAYDCIDPNICTVGGYDVTYNSGDYSFTVAPST